MTTNVGITIRRRKNRDNRIGLEQDEDKFEVRGAGRAPAAECLGLSFSGRIDLSEQYCTEAAKPSRLGGNYGSAHGH